MKEQNFNWMLQGCHSVTDVAVAYFSNYQHNCSAVKTLRKAVAEHAMLQEDLAAAGYTPKTTLLTPKHILAFIRQWGMPAMVRNEIEKNPYLAVPKMREKI